MRGGGGGGEGLEAEAEAALAPGASSPGRPSYLRERLCVSAIGAAATAPVYYILYCLGWLKFCQGKSVVLMLLVTFYPAGLLTLLLQLSCDYKFDTAYGRRRAMLVRFLVTVSINVTLLPAILPYAPSTAVLAGLFCVLGFCNAACVGSAYEVCLQMPPESKMVQYLSVGLQAGGVATGVIGALSGYTTSDQGAGRGGGAQAPPPALVYAPAPPPRLSCPFTAGTCAVCAGGLLGILALHYSSKHYCRVLGATLRKGAGDAGGVGVPPPDLSQALHDMCNYHGTSIWTLMVTTSMTALTTGFYPFCPSSANGSRPEENAKLVVLLVYVNQIFDLVGRFLTTFLPCPSSLNLILLTNGRLIILVPAFFVYILQRAYVNDAVAIFLVASLQLSHGVLQTWAFVHVSMADGGLPRKPDEKKSMPWVSKMLMVILQSAVVLGGITGQLIATVF